MSVTITLGKSGRIVVPKAIRDALGLQEGSRLKLEVQGGRIEAVPEAEEVPILVENGFPVFQGGSKLTEGEIVSIIKSDRDARDERLAGQSANRAR